MRPAYWLTSRRIAFAATLAVGCAAHQPVVEGPWLTAYTADSTLELQVPPRSESFGKTDCWGMPSGGKAKRSRFCIEVTTPDLAARQSLSRFAACSERFADAACYTEASVDTLKLTGRQVVVTRARLSGTFGHYRAIPTVLMEIPLDSARVGLLEAYLTDYRDTTSVFRLAGSLRARAYNPDSEPTTR